MRNSARFYRLITCVAAVVISTNIIFGSAGPSLASAAQTGTTGSAAEEEPADAEYDTDTEPAASADMEDVEEQASSDVQEPEIMQDEQDMGGQEKEDGGTERHGPPSDETEEEDAAGEDGSVSGYHGAAVLEDRVSVQTDGILSDGTDVVITPKDKKDCAQYVPDTEELLYAFILRVGRDGRDLKAEEELYVKVTAEEFKDRDKVRVRVADIDGSRKETAEALPEEDVRSSGDGTVSMAVKGSYVYMVTACPAAEESRKEKTEEDKEVRSRDDRDTEGKEQEQPAATLKAPGAVLTVYGQSAEEAPKETAGVFIELEDGLETIAFYTMPEKEQVPSRKAKAAGKKNAEQCLVEVVPEDSPQDKRESLVLYAVSSDGTAAPAPVEDGRYRIPENSAGFAVVRDTGYRRMSIEADQGENATGTVITLEGMLPKGASAEAVDALTEFGDGYAVEGKLLAAYDISIYEGGSEYEPDGDHPVGVTVSGLKLEEEKTYSVWHLSDDGTAERVEGVQQSDGVLMFTARSFSVYAVTEGPEPYDDTGIECAEDIGSLTGSRSENGFYMYVTRGTSNSYYFKNTINQSQKAFAVTTDISEGAVWYLEETDGGFLISTMTQDGKVYVKNDGGNYVGLTPSVSDAGKFIISNPGTGVFLFKLDGTGKYLQYSNGGKGIRFYDGTGAPGNSQIMLPYADSVAGEDDDIYGLDGKSHGLMVYSDGVAGYALMGKESGNTLASERLIVRPDTVNGSGLLYVTEESGISGWTFHHAAGDTYKLSVMTDDGEKYLKTDGDTISLSDEENASQIKVIPGKDGNRGKVRLLAGSRAITSDSGRFKMTADNASNAAQWFSFVEKTGLNNDDFVVYSAKKVSVSDTDEVTNGTGVIVYAREWNNETKQYEFYAVSHNGTLVRCFESGDTIEWVGNKFNTLVWNFTEYYWEGTDTPNGYYELKNRYSGKYIAPMVENSDCFSDEPVGLNMYGRQYGDYYTALVAWDDPHYAFAGIKTENGHIVSCPFAEAEDFYFAIVQDRQDAEDLTPIPTVDNSQYGITMRLIDFGGSNQKQNTFLGSSAGGMNVPPTQGLLSTSLGEDGYPTAAGGSLKNLYSGAEDVNHLFIESTLSGTGYFEFDSTQNFASINGDNNFTVYTELGTTDNTSKPSLKHGQFFPFDDLVPGRFASINDENLYDSQLAPLDDTDPRKYEKMYLVPTPDYYFGMEIGASFVQTPSGLDAWGHDIIYEFTGDDDFWLYVDGELVIDLGGIHSALPGSINYRTGEVTVNGNHTTLKQIFEDNYRGRGMPEDKISEKIGELFEQNESGQYVFRDYSTHNMKIFFMERGAGASNLHMRFNLSSVKKNQVLLRKKITGTDRSDYKLAEYAYQIWYRTEEDEGYVLLGNTTDEGKPSVTYQNTRVPVKYRERYRVAGGTQEYDSCFFLTPNQAAEITLPEGAVSYRIKECGVNSQVYDRVSVNGADVTGTPAADPGRQDFDSGERDQESQKQVVFENHVNGSAKRTLTITKRLYDAENRLITDDHTGFSMRLYLGNENDSQPAAAEMQDYFVRDPEGNYCRWDADGQGFVSVGKTDYAELTQSEKQAAAFHTSINGMISKIPAGYRVEVRDLLVGTTFRVEEKPEEIPDGYSFIEYVRDAASYIIEDGDTINSGIIRDNDSPAIEVHNRRGFGITAVKEWSDNDYVDMHGDIFTAVYVRGALIDGSVRKISHPGNSVYYYWDSLSPDAALQDYTVREVTIEGGYTADDDGKVTLDEGSTAAPVGENEAVHVHAEWGDGLEGDPEYRVTYKKGIPSGQTGNVRTDRIINTRSGIRIVKEDMDGTPLSGAWFTLTDRNGDFAGRDHYVSDAEGIVTMAYLDPDEEYTLTEVKAPAGHLAPDGPVKITVGTSGTITVSGGGGLAAADQDTGTVSIKNKRVSLDAVNVGIGTMGLESWLPGSTFELYKGTDTGNGPVMEYHPMPGYEDLVSADGTAVIGRIDHSLPAGTYFIKQTFAAANYRLIPEPVEFSVGETGRVTLRQTDHARLETEERDGTVHYRIVVINRKSAIIDTGYFVKTPFIMALVSAAALAAAAWRRRKPR